MSNDEVLLEKRTLLWSQTFWQVMRGLSKVDIIPEHTASACDAAIKSILSASPLISCAKSGFSESNLCNCCCGSSLGNISATFCDPIAS